MEFHYNISRHVWVAKKRSPNQDLRWKGLGNEIPVLKHDIATIYREYLVRQMAVMPWKPPIGKTLFYTIANNITGGGLQEAWAGVDYIKVKGQVTYEELDLEKNLSKWKKPELEAYLSHHKIAKTENKPELFKRVSEHMHTTTTEQQ